MDARKCSAYNKTRRSELCAQATVIDSARDPLRVLKVLIEGLDPETKAGIYLKNFSGVPVAGALSSFDLVYLDQSERVMQGVALSPDFEAMPFTGRAAAALVLPSGTLASSRTAKGDALTITVIEEAASQPARAAARPAGPGFSTDWLSRILPADEFPAAAETTEKEPAAMPGEVAPEKGDIALQQAAAVPEPVEAGLEEILAAPEEGAAVEEEVEAVAERAAVAPEPAVAAPEEAEGEPEETEAAAEEVEAAREQAGEPAKSEQPAGVADSEDEQLVLVFADEVVGEPEVVSVESLAEPAAEQAEHETEEVLEQAAVEPSPVGDVYGREQVVLQQVEAIETAGLAGNADSLEADLRRLVTQKLGEKGKAGSPGKKEPLEVELRRLVSARGSRLKRIQLWTSSVFAKGFSGSPARARAMKAAQLGPVDWVGDQPRRAAAAGASAAAQQQPALKEPLKIRFLRRIDYFLRWLSYEEDLQTPIIQPETEEQRRGDRVLFPNMIAFFWTGGVPKPYKIGNISVSGFYLITDDRWSPGTVIRMTLQRGDAPGDDPRDTITVFARVVRWGADGEGFEFVLTKLLE